jgi:hypothetical protein
MEAVIDIIIICICIWFLLRVFDLLISRHDYSADFAYLINKLNEIEEKLDSGLDEIAETLEEIEENVSKDN